VVEVVEKVICKNCGSDSVIKYGNYKKVQEYFCKSCRRKFKHDDLPFHTQVSTTYVNTVLNMYYGGFCINKIRRFLRATNNYLPSKHSIFNWLTKYSSIATLISLDDHPNVGYIWIAEETIVEWKKGFFIRFFDILDTETWYLLASESTLIQNIDYQQLINRSIQKAGKIPQIVITSKPASCLSNNQIKAPDAKFPFHLISFNDAKPHLNHFQDFITDRAKILKRIRNPDRLKLFINGYQVYHNYFKTKDALNGKTPAEEAQTKCQLANWTDLIRLQGINSI
jgi:transposase-like protein